MSPVKPNSLTLGVLSSGLWGERGVVRALPLSGMALRWEERGEAEEGEAVQSTAGEQRPMEMCAT